jgi:hypothetical protein
MCSMGHCVVGTSTPTRSETNTIEPSRPARQMASAMRTAAGAAWEVPPASSPPIISRTRS